jgi:ribosome-binding factor A
MANQIRLKRIADQIREEFSALLVRQVADPRLEGITVTDVKVDRELAFADIFVSAWQGHERSEEVIAALRHASGFLRTELAGKLDLRSMPRLRFHWDLTPEKADHIEKLLLEIQHEREQREGELPPPGDNPSAEESSSEGEEDE